MIHSILEIHQTNFVVYQDGEKTPYLEKELETTDLLQKRAEELSVEDFIIITLACQKK